MEFEKLFDMLILLVGIATVSGFFYGYFRFEKFRNIVKKVLPFLPSLLFFLGSKVEDEKGVFDDHDFFVLLGRVTARIRIIIGDSSNIKFEDVEDEVFEIVSDELNRYRAAGVSGVPDLDDGTIRSQVRLVFDTINNATESN